MKTWLLAAWTALACGVSTPWAQETPSFEPAAAAQAALEKDGAAEFFEIVPDAGFAQVRHRASGLSCAWGPNDTAEITVFPTVPGGPPKGEDVGCSHRTPFGIHSFYATRHPPQLTAKAALQSAVMSLKLRSPKAKSVRPAPPTGVAALLATKSPPTGTAQFLIEVDGRPVMTRVSVAQVDGWTIKARYTGPVGSDSRADVVWMSALRGPLKSRGLPPYDKGPLAEPPPAAN